MAISNAQSVTESKKPKPAMEEIIMPRKDAFLLLF
jgi:hypothetical protein